MGCCNCFGWCSTRRRRRRDNEEWLINGDDPTMEGCHNKALSDPSRGYACPVIMPLREGLSFYIRGRVLKTCERFAINLVLNNEKQDIALHFNPRLPQNYVVRNSLINGKWGKEERCATLPFTLHRNTEFLVQILVTEAEYLISVNGHHFTTYKHRIPMQHVKMIEVHGSVADVSCEQSIVDEYPVPAPEVQEIVYVDDSNRELTDVERSLFQVPFFGKLKLPFDNGHVLHINGRLKVLPHSFYINLQVGNRIWPHPKIHFHFNPRFVINDTGEHILCCNSWLLNEWDKEERTQLKYKEFFPGKPIELRFQRTYNCYQVFMNDQMVYEFLFRDNGMLCPNTVYIEGDFKINQIFVSNSYEEYPLEEE